MDAMLDLSGMPRRSPTDDEPPRQACQRPAREVGPPCTAAHRAGRPADRRDGHRAAVPQQRDAEQRRPGRSAGASTNPTFANAKTGDCLNWPDNAMETATIVDCTDDHRFEVAEAVDMRAFPGASSARCRPAVAGAYPADHLRAVRAGGRALPRAKYDPNSRFSISMLWAGDKAWKHAGERRLLCGLQLPRAPNNQQLVFKGKVADVDQSRCGPRAACLASTHHQSAQRRAGRLLGAACHGSHREREPRREVPGGLPVDADQDAFIREVCNSLTDACLAPVKLRDTTLTLIYNTVSLPSWTAGGRQISCNIGATLGNGGWATLINTAKGPLLVNGRLGATATDPRGAAEPAAAACGLGPAGLIGSRSTMPAAMSGTASRRLVSDALDLIPARLAAAIDNVVVLVSDRHPEDPDLLGLWGHRVDRA